jgi:hypothetical protein
VSPSKAGLPPGAAQRATERGGGSGSGSGGGGGGDDEERADAEDAQAAAPAVTSEAAEQRAAALAAFFQACEEGDLAQVREALASGGVVKPGSVDKSGRTGLLYAGRGGQLEIVQALVRAGCPVGSYDKDARNALVYAARRGHVEVASWLLSQGVSPNSSDVHGLTPLHQAVLGRHTAVCELLLAAGADLQMRDSNGNTPYRLAKRFGADGREASRALLLCLRHRLGAMTREAQLAAGRDAASLPPEEGRVAASAVAVQRRDSRTGDDNV